MARPKEFERDMALVAALAVFREHGFEGSTTGMLLKSMGIGRQSFYDTFGDKQKLYYAALEHYARDETRKHMAALRVGDRGLAAIKTMMDRVITEAGEPCLGIGSICEFGCRDAAVNDINATAGKVLHAAVFARLEEARADGELATDVEPEDATRFVLANVAGIRISARGGASTSALEAIGRLTLRTLT